jgi:hypothetical protein
MKEKIDAVVFVGLKLVKNAGGKVYVTGWAR